MKHTHGIDSLGGRSESESFHVNYKTKKFSYSQLKPNQKIVVEALDLVP